MADVVFAVLPRVVLLDVAGPADAFRNAAGRAPGCYRLRFAGPTPTVEAAAGLTLGALEPLPDSLAPGTILVLTGVSGERIDAAEPATRRLIQWLRGGAAAEAL
ncbi:MAG: hypothetical protein WAN26_16470, partial [Steroidobacteraceae bacterium]